MKVENYTNNTIVFCAVIQSLCIYWKILTNVYYILYNMNRVKELAEETFDFIVFNNKM